MRPFDYTAPSRLEEAVSLLSKTPGARVLAGGSQLLVEPARSALDAPLLVDLRKVDGLGGIDVAGDGSVRIGAMATTATLAAHAALRSMHSALVEAAALVGDPQVRNRATVGGALASQEAAADLPAALLALDAQVQVAGAKGTRSVPVDAVLAGLSAGDVIASIALPAAPGAGSAYEKFKHPSTFYAICGVAASVTLAGDGSVRVCRVAVTGAASPARARAAEQALTGRTPDAGAIETAAAKVTDGLALRGDAFGSAEYRGHLARVLAARALARAVERARGK